MTLLGKLHAIEESKCIYNIHYCRAGVGFIFYYKKKVKDDDYKTGLSVDTYYPTFEKAVEAEYDRLIKEGK